MQVTVQYTAQIKAALGLAEEQVELEDTAKLSHLLTVLADRHANTFREQVWSDGNQLSPSLVLCVQDRQVPTGEDTKLHEGDTVLFLSAISGG